MQIDLIADNSVSSAPAGFTAAVQAAANTFDHDIPGNYTVNITYGWGTIDNEADPDLSPSSQDFSLGGTNLDNPVPYNIVKNWLTSAAITSAQIAAVATLPSSSPSPFYDSIALSSSQEKALGEYTGNSGAVDGSIGFNTRYVGAGGLLSEYTQEAALTEIAHALGFSSGDGTGDGAHILDLFRYSSPSVYYSDNGQPSYLSIDSGQTDLANYSTGGVDPTLFENVAHDPFTIPLVDDGAQISLTSLDLEALDVMGFEGNSNLFGTLVHDATSPAGEVYALYQTILGRPADSGGLENYTSQVSNGTSLTSVAQAMLGSAEYANHYASSTQSNSGFVTQLYLDGLHRQPDPGGLATYGNALASGVSRAQVAVDIATSAESQGHLSSTLQTGLLLPDATDTAIAQLYYGLLDRGPDATGLANLEVDSARGASMSDLASGFINSSEYAALHGPQNNTQFVTALYEGALGRNPDSGGLNTYMTALNGGASRASIALDIVESPEADVHLAPLIQGNYNLA